MWLTDFGRALWSRARWNFVEMLLALRAAALAGVRMVARRLTHLSQVGRQNSPERTKVAFSREEIVLRTREFYLTPTQNLLLYVLVPCDLYTGHGTCGTW